MIQQLLQLAKTRPLKSYSSTKEWAVDYFQLTRDQAPIEKAIIGGFCCQQFSFAFMAGYQAALEKMFPTIAPHQVKALCVSEGKGIPLNAIKTTLVNNRINGLKNYITAGSEVQHLLVLCRTEESKNGRPLLKMVHLPSDTANCQITDFEMPFMQEVKHGKLALDNTKILDNQILEGDGFSEYTKPFRTLEDICIAAAHQSMLLRQAIDYQWDESIRDHLLFQLFSLKNLINLPLVAKETHLLVAANEHNFEKLFPDIESNISNRSPAIFQKDWSLNKRVLSLGDEVKALRLLKARKVVFD